MIISRLAISVHAACVRVCASAKHPLSSANITILLLIIVIVYYFTTLMHVYCCILIHAIIIFYTFFTAPRHVAVRLPITWLQSADHIERCISCGQFGQQPV